MMESPLQRGIASERPSRLRSRGGEAPPPAPIEAEEPSEEAGSEETAVHYYFPVEVEVRAAPEPIDPDDVVALALYRLASRLENS
jgi:hypothetical protein